MQTGKITAKETYYKGYRFRSRLEARWAVFFDVLEVRWVYEPEGYRLPNGQLYLPDFYLPDIDTWVEIKGVVTEKDDRKVSDFSDKDFQSDTKHKIVMLGDIPDETNDLVSWIYERYRDEIKVFTNGWDFPYVPCICPACGKVGFEFDGRGWRICNHLNEAKTLTEEEMLEKRIYEDKKGNVQKMKYPDWAGWRMDDKGYTADHPLLRKAYRIARQARFEHGENPGSLILQEQKDKVKDILDSLKNTEDIPTAIREFKELFNIEEDDK